MITKKAWDFFVFIVIATLVVWMLLTVIHTADYCNEHYAGMTAADTPAYCIRYMVK